MRRGHSTQKGTKVFGNASRFESTWICGPMHEHIEQHVPGYKGHYHGQVDAGTIPKSFAKITAHMLAKRHNRTRAQEIADNNVTKPEFLSSYTREYKPKNFRRFGK